MTILDAFPRLIPKGRGDVIDYGFLRYKRRLTYHGMLFLGMDSEAI